MTPKRFFIDKVAPVQRCVFVQDIRQTRLLQDQERVVAMSRALCDNDRRCTQREKRFNGTPHAELMKSDTK